MAARVSQEVIEALDTTDANARVSQQVVEALDITDANVRVSQQVVEALDRTDNNVRCSQLVVEVLMLNFEVLMPAIYPTVPGLAYTVGWRPMFFNMPTMTAASGAELDLAYAQNPLHEFTLQYNFLREQPGYTEQRLMMGFFLSMGGNHGRFLFNWPADNRVEHQVIAEADGTSHLFTLVRTYGIGENSGTEPVGYVDDTQPFNVYVDGVLQPPSAYTLLRTEPANQQIQMATPPTAGQVISVDMSYFYYCKFAEPSIDYEEFVNRIWSLGEVVIRSCRPGT